MLKSKQRSELKKLANTLEVTLTMGKNSITDAFLKELEVQFKAHELVKIHILDKDLDVKELANEIAKLSRSEYVQSIGSKVVLYKKNYDLPKNKRIEI